MSVLKGAIRAGLIAAGLSMAAAAAQAAAPVDPSKPPPASDHLDKCFYLSDWENWTSPSDDVIYLRVRTNDVYKIALSTPSSELRWPDVHLVNRVYGVDSVCYPIDLDMSVSDGTGIHERLIAKAITRLTPEEIAAIPKKYRP